MADRESEEPGAPGDGGKSAVEAVATADPAAPARDCDAVRAAGRPASFRGKGIVACLTLDRVLVLDIDPRPDRFTAAVLADEAVPPPSESQRGIDVPGVMQAFDRAVHRLPRARRQLSVLLAEPLITDRVLHLPKVKERQVREMVIQASRTEGATVHTFQLAGVSVQDGREGLAVHVAMARGDVLDSIERTAARNGAWIRSTSSRPVGGLVMIEHFGAAGLADGRFLMVEVRPTKLRLTLVVDRAIRSTRTLEIGGTQRPGDIAARCITEVQRTNIFLSQRFRETPASRMVVLGEDRGVVEEIVGRLKAQFEIDADPVVPRIEILEAPSAEAGDWVYDAACHLVAHRPATTGSLSVQAPSRLRRRRTFQLLPFVAIVSAILLAAGWWYDREAGTRLAGLQHGLRTAREEAALVEAAPLDPARVIEARGLLTSRVEALAAAAGSPRPMAPELEAVLRRIPKDIILGRASYRRREGSSAAAPAPAGVVAPIAIAAAPAEARGDRVVLEGFGIFDHEAGPARTAEVRKRILEAEPVKSCSDESGDYDPFKKDAQAGTGRLYPVRFVLELKESR